ncbi:MAG: hypothetical protein KDG55_24300, partial [Rhodocyclaceae bacterium]|nr:hypothetical protein [Rhodocyclaceae bacterium]
PSTKPAGRRFAPDDIDGMARWIAETPDGPDVWQLSGAISQRADLTRAAEALRAHPLLRDRALTIRVAWSNTPDATLLLGPVQTPE